MHGGKKSVYKFFLLIQRFWLEFLPYKREALYFNLWKEREKVVINML